MVKNGLKFGLKKFKGLMLKKNSKDYLIKYKNGRRWINAIG